MKVANILRPTRAGVLHGLARPALPLAPIALPSGQAHPRLSHATKSPARALPAPILAGQGYARKRTYRPRVGFADP
eukprot:15435166-Alexandrium_andersonii.AAC.2